MSLDNIQIFRDFGKSSIGLVEDFEKENNIFFPENYKKFTCDHNGAYLDKICFDFFCQRQNTTDSSSFFSWVLAQKKGLCMKVRILSIIKIMMFMGMMT